MMAVTWDFGQTLAELDTAMLARRALERGVSVDPAALEAATEAAWAAYDAAIAAGAGGHPWRTLMRTLLRAAGAPEAALPELVEWLFQEQPRCNLWRRPIAGMFELARELHARGVPQAVVSNSEGGLAQLLTEVGLGDLFQVVADSGRLGVEKPAPGIFRFALEQLGVEPERAVHVGDSWQADVAGALGAGLSAVWFRGRGAAPGNVDGVRVARADDAASTARALAAFGV